MYILTKTGIFDTSKYEKFGEDSKYILYRSEKPQPNGQHFTQINKSAIIKQDEDLLKLCDEYVLKYKCEERPRHETIEGLLHAMDVAKVTMKEHIQWLFEAFEDKLEFVKLGIWTSKGLIYVVEYNKEGEPKLL